ncbi:hypothetical protein PSEUBRA_005527 [Kalmanozyma brasiliensis GHG001]|uniref:Uncharacterized protein n=1 Tax=Kalmanozyma brasiliensis (strain GHG001) TaxID=1365824 RepID=V5ETD0_KALBG|nr:uncharacterized protein PSEUBRA_005527 [Kalmanozyma brasiliensis GHG001]EST05259.1 hypothetical protein PSEUBRA_005527 [Kalmanozyma brasiliensis GHG001]
MERILGTIFPCCFPARRGRRSSAGEHNERTPLLPDSAQAGSSRNSLNGSGIATPGSDRRVKRQSVLPAPAYDAHVLRGIVDEFRGRIISVDPAAGAGAGVGEKSGVLVGPEEVGEAQAGRAQSGEGRHVTPVHTLTLGATAERGGTRLVDIWSDPTPPPAAASGAGVGMSYSAAAKRAPAIAPGKKAKRGAKATATATAAKGTEEGVEQRTYEALAEMVRAKPVVFDWAEEGDAE